METLNPDKLIRLSKSCLGETEKRAAMGVLDREYLGMGAEVQHFERLLSNFFGRPTVCVVNGTAALHLALQAAGIGPGDEVLVQSLTYVASFQAISATGAKPVACDVEPETLTLNWRDAERRISARTKAVMPVHYAGSVGNLDKIYAFAEGYGLRIIEDAAHAFGTSYRGKRVGGFGDIACFSFDGIKSITSGEGGCIVTDDEDILRRIQDARLLGVEKDTEKRYTGERSWEFDVTTQGWRYHMSNLMAAIGIAQMQRFPEFAAKRQSLGMAYQERLARHPNLNLLVADYSQIVPHIFPILIRDHNRRDGLRAKLLRKNIQTGIHYQPNHLLSYYRDENSIELIDTEAFYRRLITLPLHPDLQKGDIEKVCDTLLEGLLD